MITEEQIQQEAENRSRHFENYNQEIAYSQGFEDGAEWMQEKLEPKWVPCNHLDVLTKGTYALYLFNPLTKIGEIKCIEIHKEKQAISYVFATHYCQINLPEPPKTK